jgi:hypothetical protein
MLPRGLLLPRALALLHPFLAGRLAIRRAVCDESTYPGDESAAREQSLQAILRIARGLSDDDLKLLLDLARRLLERT